MILPISNLKDFADKDPWMQKLRANSFGIILPSGWFGRPFDNQHSIDNIIVSNDRLSIVFDGIRKIEIVDPRSFEIQTNGPYSSLKLYGSRKIAFSWIPYGEGLTVNQIEKNRKAAVRLLKIVVKNINRIPEHRRRSVLNEYYWFSKQPLKQYNLGVAEVRKGTLGAFYSQGVGAVSCAELCAKRGDAKGMMKWAQRSTQAWENYFTVVPRYYNAWCWYATALGLLGQYDEMQTALRKTAKFSGRTWDYSEFKEFQWKVWNSKLALRQKMSPRGQKYWRLFPGWQIDNLDLRADFLHIAKIEKKKGIAGYWKGVEALKKKYPKEVFATCWAAAVWGDWGQMISEKAERAMKKKAVSDLKKLLPLIKAQNPRLQLSIYNEIYYHSCDFLNQYKLGVRTNKTLPCQGYFSMGVGASEHGYQLFEKGKRRAAKKWGQIAVASWQREAVDPLSLNNNCFYIQALALSGSNQHARSLLNKVMADKKKHREYARWYKKYNERLDLIKKGKAGRAE